MPSISSILAGIAIVAVAVFGLYFWWSQDKIDRLEQNVATLTSAFQDQKKATDFIVEKFKNYDALMSKFEDQVSEIRDDVDKRNADVASSVVNAKHKKPSEIKADADKLIRDQFDRLKNLSRE